MKEIRIWSPQRAVHDLFHYKNRDLSSHHAANLWAYWKIEKNIYDLANFIDKSPNG